MIFGVNYKAGGRDGRAPRGRLAVDDRSRTDLHRDASALSRLREELARDRESVRTVTSEALFGGHREIGIDHRGALYRLKITRQGKLILNK
ncbi:MAG TPA: hemin uptake protein HemP [Rhizobiales bacterium]|nr:hemin uptake protein HemP [Hyphomicrobiales bacterium]